jgi:hypothetical protein
VVADHLDFHALISQVLLQIRDGLPQRARRFGSSDRGGDYPQTELIIFQTSLEIRNQDFQQVLFGLVKVTEMSAPRHVAYRTYSALSQVWVVWSVGHKLAACWLPRLPALQKYAKLLPFQIIGQQAKTSAAISERPTDLEWIAGCRFFPDDRPAI